MIRVLIAEDELLPRIGLKSLIDWEAQGYELVGECDNGQIALEKARELRPDIVITDIKMPVLSGIELMNRIKQENLPCKFIALSGYDDFEYVRQALVQGAEDYLLKLEMNREALLGVLNRTKEKIFAERKQAQEKEKKDLLYARNFSKLREQFLLDCAHGDLTDPAELARKMEELEVGLPPENLLCFLLRLSPPDAEMQPLVPSSALGMVKNVAREYGKAGIVPMRGRIAGILSLNSRDGTAVSRMADNFRFVLKNALNLDPQVVCSKVFDGFGGIPEAFASLRGLLAEKNPDQLMIPLERDLRLLEKALKSCEREAVLENLSRIREKAAEAEDFYEERLEGVCYTVLFLVNGFCAQNRIERERIFAEREPYEEVRRMRTPADCARWLEKLGRALDAFFSGNDGSTAVMLRVRRYVCENLGRELSLDMIASAVGLSPGYLSRLFCRQSGGTLVNYISGCRIERAKELLKYSNEKIYEIARQVGYENPHYFSRIFKKHTGLTPYEYKAK